MSAITNKTAQSTKISKKTRLSDLIHYRLKVTTLDGRYVIGELLAFDKYMNLVLADAQEFRLTKGSKMNIREAKRNGELDTSDLVKEDKRSLGLIILRGTTVVGTSIVSGPTADQSTRLGLDKKKNKIIGSAGVMKPMSKKGDSAGNARLAAALKAPMKSIGSVGGRSFKPPPGFKKN